MAEINNFYRAPRASEYHLQCPLHFAVNVKGQDRDPNSFEKAAGRLLNPFFNHCSH